MSKIRLVTFIFVAIISLAVRSLAEAAGPITHVYLAMEWIAQLDRYHSEEQQSFIRGTLYPDIRYLGAVERSDTHELDVTLEEIILSEMPFYAGKKLHSYIDIERERFVLECAIYETLIQTHGVPTDNIATFLKLIEDEILFKAIAPIKAAAFFSQIDPEEFDNNIKPELVRRWHFMMRNYLSMPPSVVLAQLASMDSGFFGASPELIKIWSHLLPQIIQDDAILIYTSELVKLFKLQFENQLLH